MTVEAEALKAKGEITLKINRALQSIPLNEILFIQSFGNYIKVHTHTSILLCLTTTHEMENNLPDNEFIRVHKSFIVNRSKVTSLTESTLCLHEQSIPIGKTYKQYVHHILRRSVT